MKCGRESILNQESWIPAHPSGVGNDKNQKFVVSSLNDLSKTIIFSLIKNKG
jgi:hypothetical protein